MAESGLIYSLALTGIIGTLMYYLIVGGVSAIAISKTVGFGTIGWIILAIVFIKFMRR